MRSFNVFLATTSLLTGLPAIGQEAPRRNGVWAQTYTDLKADPKIRFGQLPNGLRYAVMHNATPAAQMSLRLYIGSGSMAEEADQQGLAHFLEHMAFRGSAHVPDGEMVHILQRHGLAFGADTNASTTQNATTYQLDFPRVDQDSIDTGLMLFRDIASELTLSKNSMESERGVILSEERLRDSPAFRATKALYDFNLQGQLAPMRWPIGQIDVIKHASVSRLRAFYDAHYRPDNAVVIAIGDFDADAMEAGIKKQFADWKPMGLTVSQLNVGRVPKRNEQTKVFFEPGAPEITQVTWVRPYENQPDTQKRERADFVRLVATTILNQRFTDLGRQPNPPFAAAFFAQNNVLKSANLTNLTLTAPPAQRTDALKALVDEYRRALKYGFTSAELTRAITTLGISYQNAASGAKTRKNTEIASNLIFNIEEDGVATSPNDDLSMVQKWSKTISVDETNAVLRASFTGFGPLIFVSSQTPLKGGEQAITGSFDTALRDKVSQNPAFIKLSWPYQSFGKPSTVTERHEIPDLGLTEVSFANGVRLTIKPTAFANDEVLVAVAFGHGRLGLPADLSRSFWTANGFAPVFVEGGTGKLSAQSIQQALVGKIATTTLKMQDDAFLLQGRTRPSDLMIQLQLLAAYFADPGFRPEAFNRMRLAVAGMLPQFSTTPMAVFSRDIGVILHNGDARWQMVPSTTALASSKPDDVPTLLKTALSGPLDVTIVGNISVDDAVNQTGATFGALALRSPQATVVNSVRFPSPTTEPKVLADAGRPDQAVAIEAWPGPGLYENEKDARALVVAAAILQTRVTERLRAAEGVTYSPAVQASSSDMLPNYGFMLGVVEIEPTRIPAFYNELDQIISDLDNHRVSADELLRAKQPLLEKNKRDRQDNTYWLNTLYNIRTDARKSNIIRTDITGIEDVTSADVQNVVTRYLLPSKSIKESIRFRVLN